MVEAVTIENWSFVAVSSFFFQAEDGIRDSPVTGVQTCALPISNGYVFEVVDANRTPEV